MAFELNMTEKTPEVFFDSEEGRFIFRGIIMPENAMEFFKPLFNYATSYLKEPLAETTVEIDLEYFNTSASRMLYQFMKSFADAANYKTTQVTMKWMYEDDDPDMEEAGEEFKLLFEGVDFQLVKIDRPKIYKIVNA